LFQTHDFPPALLGAPVFISASDFACRKRLAEVMPRPRKHRWTRLWRLFQTASRVPRGAFPSPELPTFNGLYPPIVARQVSQ
jgi:hypothetical protein